MPGSELRHESLGKSLTEDFPRSLEYYTRVTNPLYTQPQASIKPDTNEAYAWDGRDTALENFGYKDA
jgi:hypothetical protein